MGKRWAYRRTNILKENNVLLNITAPRPYLIRKDDEERINAEAESLLKEGKIKEYNQKMEGGVHVKENLDVILIISVVVLTVLVVAYLLNKYQVFKEVLKYVADNEELIVRLIKTLVGDHLNDEDIEIFKLVISRIYDYSKDNDFTEEEIKEFIKETLESYGLQVDEEIIEIVSKLLNVVEDKIKD